MYADKKKKQMMYGEFENWLNMYGKNITVGKSNKTYIQYWRRGLRRMMISQGRQWSPNALEARRKRRKNIIQIGVTIYGVRCGQGRKGRSRIETKVERWKS